MKTYVEILYLWNWSIFPLLLCFVFGAYICYRSTVISDGKFRSDVFFFTRNNILFYSLLGNFSIFFVSYFINASISFYLLLCMLIPYYGIRKIYGNMMG